VFPPSPPQGVTVSVSIYTMEHGPHDFIVKTSTMTLEGHFLGEALSLKALKHTDTIKVPTVMHFGEESLWHFGEDFGDGPVDMGICRSFLILEALEKDPSPYDLPAPTIFGRRMAELHSAAPRSVEAREGQFGFPSDTTLSGSMVHQRNDWTYDWIHFFRFSRIEDQLEQAKFSNQNSLLDEGLLKEWENVLEATNNLLKLFEGVDVRPVTLHGNLWNANIASVGGWPTLFDPASYYGHHEAEWGLKWCADLGPDFWKGYRQLIPKDQGFEERAILYEIYHKLVQYNQHGGKFGNNAVELMRLLVMTFTKRRELRSSANASDGTHALLGVAASMRTNLSHVPSAASRYRQRRSERRRSMLEAPQTPRRVPGASDSRGTVAQGGAIAASAPQCELVSSETGAWLDAYRKRVEDWWLVTPYAEALSTCASALGLHLASRLETAYRSWRALQPWKAQLPQRKQPSAQRPDDECSWIRDGATQLELPDLPPFPTGPSEFELPAIIPIPRLLPTWQFLQSRSPQQRAYGIAASGAPSNVAYPAETRGLGGDFEARPREALSSVATLSLGAVMGMALGGLLAVCIFRRSARRHNVRLRQISRAAISHAPES